MKNATNRNMEECFNDIIFLLVASGCMYGNPLETNKELN